MTLRSLLLATSACLLLAPLFAGCGGAASPSVEAAHSSAGLADDLSTPEGAAAAVDRAERSLDQLLGPSPSTTISQQAGAAQPFATPPAAPEPSPPPPPPPPAATVAPAPSTDQANERKAADASPPALSATALDSCSTACSALASMTRAAEHLCSLAGAADTRCTSARTRVHAATTRVHASCPTCGA
jgi:predicted RNA-binding Zn-ribbon protein involved in translation (DUF1610 family)